MEPDSNELVVHPIAKKTNIFSTFVSCHANIKDFKENRNIYLAISRIYDHKKRKILTDLKKIVTDPLELVQAEIEIDKIIDKYMTALSKIKICISYLAEIGSYGLYFDNIMQTGVSSTKLECLSFVHDFVNNIFTKPDDLTEKQIVEFILKRNLNLRLLRLSIILINQWELHTEGKIFKNYIDAILNSIRVGKMKPENAPFYQTFYGTLGDFPVDQEWGFQDSEIDSLMISMSNLRTFEKEDLCAFPDIYKNLDLKPTIIKTDTGSNERKSSVGLRALKKIFIKPYDEEEKSKKITKTFIKALFDKTLITDITDLPGKSKWSSSREFFSIIPLLEEKFNCNLVVDFVVNACGIVIQDGDDDDDVNDNSRRLRQSEPEKYKLNASQIADFKHLFNTLYKNETQLKQYLSQHGGVYGGVKKKLTLNKNPKKPKRAKSKKTVEKKTPLAFNGKEYLKQRISKLLDNADCNSTVEIPTQKYKINYKDNCEDSIIKPIFSINPNIKEASDISLTNAILGEFEKPEGGTETVEDWNKMYEETEKMLDDSISKFNSTRLNIDDSTKAWGHMLMRFRAYLDIIRSSRLPDTDKEKGIEKIKERFKFEATAIALDYGQYFDVDVFNIESEANPIIKKILTDAMRRVLIHLGKDRRHFRKESRDRSASRSRTTGRTSGRTRGRTRSRDA
jgi:hypothetical protein